MSQKNVVRDARRQWVAPVATRLLAGAAESSDGPALDGGGAQS